MPRVSILICFGIFLSASLPTCNAEDDTCAAGPGKCGAPPDAEFGTTILLDDFITGMCPTTKITGGKLMGGLLRMLSYFSQVVDRMTPWKDMFTAGWADDYSIATYEFIGQVTMRIYKARNKDYVNVPTEMGGDEVVKVGSNYVPHDDVDGTPNFLWIERYIPGFLKPFILKPFYAPFLTCFMGGLASMPFEDTIDDPKFNTWSILDGTKYNDKKEWLLSFYNNLKTMNGDPSWPTQRMDFTTLYRNGDHWDDGLESTMAFVGIGVHRVESVSQEFAGEVLPFAIKLNDFNSLAVRPHFGKYGGDMYFTAEGLPAGLQTSDGKWIKRGEKDWQYWKFVWRSSLVTVITLCDHLYLTHFKASNTLARASRVALPPDHSLRRLLSIFTFGAIFVNLQAQFVLVGKDGLLNRATPFENFADLSDVVPQMIQDVAAAPGMGAIIDDEVFEKLPAKLQEAPFYADGRLVFKSMLKLAQRFNKASGQCAGLKHDIHIQKFIRMLKHQMEESKYKSNFTSLNLAADDTTEVCAIMDKRLAVYMFMVSAWHSHVGFVGDYYADPDLAGMSWKEGESFSRPRQAMITSIINIFTSTKQPFLMEDYTHLFKGLGADLSAKSTKIWHDFVEDLHQVKKEIDRRNTGRSVPNINMDPAILECSVAK